MPAIFTPSDKEGLRRRMLDAGWSCLLARGYRAMRIEDIAQEAGIAASTFYGFFSSKTAFVTEMVAENRRELVGALERELARAERGGERAVLERWMREVWHGERCIFRCLSRQDFQRIRAGLPDDVVMGPEMSGGALERLLERSVGEARDADLELAESLQRVCAVTLLARDAFTAEELERAVDALIDMTLDALFGTRHGRGEE